MVILFSNNEIVVIKTQLILKSANKFNDSKYFLFFQKKDKRWVYFSFITDSSNLS